jgi:hypothetical protein
VRLNVVCFTLAGDVTEHRVAGFLDMVSRTGDVALTPTTLGGVPGIRAAFSNWRTTADDVDLVWAALRACAAGR